MIILKFLHQLLEYHSYDDCTCNSKIWKVHQMDVKLVFFNGVLEEEVFIELPLECIKKEKEKQVYKLKKALYGLKRLPRV